MAETSKKERNTERLKGNGLEETDQVNTQHKKPGAM